MRTEKEMIAYALEVEPELFPFVLQLLTDLDELGSDADLIVRAVQHSDPPVNATVLDLGCGKGAVSVAIAERLGLLVHGVDLFEPFIPACEAAAAAAGVADRCRFECANILELRGRVPLADVAIFAALGDVLGPLDATMGVLRALVKPGGIIVVSDGFIEDGSVDFPGFGGYVPRAQTRRRLEAHGDTIEQEILDDDENDDADEAALIRARAEVLAAAHPEHAEALLAYAGEQQAEYDFLAEHFVGATWVVRRQA